MIPERVAKLGLSVHIHSLYKTVNEYESAHIKRALVKLAPSNLQDISSTFITTFEIQ